jgi:hypothetical protein
MTTTLCRCRTTTPARRLERYAAQARRHHSFRQWQPVQAIRPSQRGEREREAFRAAWREYCADGALVHGR